MADYGLLGGVAEGLNKGLQAYTEERRYIDKKKQEEEERSLKKKMFAAELAGKGLRQVGEDFEVSPEKKKTSAMDSAIKRAGLLKEGFDVGEYDEDKNQYGLVRVPGLQDKKLKEDSLKIASQLRDEYGKLPDVKDSATILRSYENIVSAADQPSAAGDLSLIFSYMKMLDPGSTVREGEFANAQNAASVPDRVRNAYNRTMSGERLNPTQRGDFVNQASLLAENARARIVSTQGRYKGLSSRYGVDPSLVYEPAGELRRPRGILGNTGSVQSSQGKEKMVRAYKQDGSFDLIPESEARKLGYGGK